jgi:hypothetical protein
MVGDAHTLGDRSVYRRMTSICPWKMYSERNFVMKTHQYSQLLAWRIKNATL